MLTFIQQKLARFRLGENTFLMIMAAIIGLAAGFGAWVFGLMIEWTGKMSIGLQHSVLGALSTTPWWQIVLGTFLGGILVGPLVYFFAREAKGHGVPEVMNSVALEGGKIRPRVVLVKAVASAITIGTGGSVGQEGPIIQIGAAAGSSLGQWLKVSSEHLRVLVACGAAGGIAATFNAPIAGVVFAIEIIVGNYALPTLTPMVLASVLATVVRRAMEGDFASFSIPAYHMVSPFEILPYLGLAALCAAMAVIFSRSLYKMEDLVDAIPIPEWSKTGLGMLALGFLVMAVPRLYGGGYETMTAALRGELVWTTLLGLFALKLVATNWTLAWGGSGGIFAPSLFLGAALGGAYGQWIHGLFPQWTAESGAYGVVGMAAMVAGATHAPMTAFLIIFEMTADYHLILPLMMCSILASYFASVLDRDSIYTRKLTRRGVDLSKGMEVSIMQGVRVRDVMNRHVEPIREETHFDAMLGVILNSRSATHYVVDKENHYQGIIDSQAMKDMLSERDALSALLVAKDVANHDAVSTVTIDDTLADCMEKFSLYLTDELPVVDSETGNRFLGAISRREILAVYSREVLRQGAEGMRFVSREQKQEERTGYVDIPDDLTLGRVVVGSKLEGKTLAELDLRNRHQLTVVAIREVPLEGRAPTTRIPDPHLPLVKGESLLMVGTPQDLANFSEPVR